MVIGDSLAQLIGGAPYSAVRVLRLAAYSAGMGAVVGHHWHRWLEAHVHPEAPGSIQAVSARALCVAWLVDGCVRRKASRMYRAVCLHRPALPGCGWP